jgi:hypothetical protein
MFQFGIALISTTKGCANRPQTFASHAVIATYASLQEVLPTQVIMDWPFFEIGIALALG